MKHQDALELMRKSLILKCIKTKYYYKLDGKTPSGEENFVFSFCPEFREGETFTVDFFEESEKDSLWEIAGKQQGTLFVCSKKHMEVSQ